jgi:hypothetical protein
MGQDCRDHASRLSSQIALDVSPLNDPPFTVGEATPAVAKLDKVAWVRRHVDVDLDIDIDLNRNLNSNSSTNSVGRVGGSRVSAFPNP